MNDGDIRAACKRLNIKCGPLTETTRPLYIRKINAKTDTKVVTPPPNAKLLTKDELALLPDAALSVLLKDYSINAPLTPSSKSLLANRLYQTIHNVETMDWDP